MKHVNIIMERSDRRYEVKMEKRIYYKADFNIEGKNVLGMVREENDNNIVEVKIENKVYNRIYNGNIYDTDNMLSEIVKLMDDENI